MNYSISIYRKIYQETTHKLMIFRNALKEKNIYVQQHQQQPFQPNLEQVEVHRLPANIRETSDSDFMPNHNYETDRNCNGINNNYVNDEGLDYSSEEDTEEDEDNDTVSQDDFHEELNYDPTNSDEIIDEGIEYLNENR